MNPNKLYCALALGLASSLGGCIVPMLDETTKYVAGVSSWEPVGDRTPTVRVLLFDRGTGSLRGQMATVGEEKEFAGRTRVTKTPESYTISTDRTLSVTPAQASLGYWMILPVSLLSTLFAEEGSGYEVKKWKTTRKAIPGEQPTGLTRMTGSALSTELRWSAVLPTRTINGHVTSDSDGEWSVALISNATVRDEIRKNMDLMETLEFKIWHERSGVSDTVVLEDDWIIRAYESTDNQSNLEPVVLGKAALLKD